MGNKLSVFVVVQMDIKPTLLWAMRELEKHINPKYLDDFNQVRALLKEGRQCDVIIVDHFVKNQSTFADIKEIKGQYPNTKILLVISASHPAEDVQNIIKTKLVNAIVLRPFTAEQILNQIYKICGLQKPHDIPWYMKAGLQK